MRRHLPQTIATLLLGAAALTAVPSHAELRAVPREDGLMSTILMTIVDHPDPIDVAAWELVGLETPHVLNPGGVVRGDGRPDLIADRSSSLPIVVWAYNAGPDRDIVMSTWDIEGWTAFEFVAGSPLDELDPRAAMDDGGRLLVTWWSPDNGVFFASREPETSSWSTPIMVTPVGREASRPSLLAFDGEVFVAYEQESLADGTREVVVARQNADSTFQQTVVAGTATAERLDPVLHRAGETMWIDWKHGDAMFGHAVANGLDWTEWSTLVLSNRTWIDVEQARAIIRGELVVP